MNVLELLKQTGTATEKVPLLEGGEYQGPCPMCGGTDRFRVWPKEGNAGKWWCRQCGKHGDAIQFVRDVRGLGYLDACDCLGVDPGGDWRDGERKRDPKAEGWTPRNTAPPCDRWREQAGDFVTRAEDTLARDPARLRWLQKERGLTAEAVKAARLGWNPKDLYLARATWGLAGEKKLCLPAGLVIPYLTEDGGLLRLKVRRPGKQEPRYVFISGGCTRTWVLPGVAGSIYVIVESELDGLLLAQEARDITGVVILGSAQARPDTESTARLTAAEVVLVSLDADAAGAKQTWAWWMRHFPKARRWSPVRGKDVTDMWRAGVPLREWLQAGLEVDRPTIDTARPEVSKPERTEAAQAEPESVDTGTDKETDIGSHEEMTRLLARIERWGLSDVMIPFELHPGESVVDMEKFLEALRRDIDAGPQGPRARTGALQADVRELKRISH